MIIRLAALAALLQCVARYGTWLIDNWFYKKNLNSEYWLNCSQHYPMPPLPPPPANEGYFVPKVVRSDAIFCCTLTRPSGQRERVQILRASIDQIFTLSIVAAPTPSDALLAAPWLWPTTSIDASSAARADWRLLRTTAQWYVFLIGVVCDVSYSCTQCIFGQGWCFAPTCQSTSAHCVRESVRDKSLFSMCFVRFLNT